MCYLLLYLFSQLIGRACAHTLVRLQLCVLLIKWRLILICICARDYVEIIGILKVVVSFILSYLAWYLQQYLQQVGGCCIFRGDIIAQSFLPRTNLVPIDKLEEGCVLTGDIRDEKFLRNYMLGYDDFNALISVMFLESVTCFYDPCATCTAHMRTRIYDKRSIN